MLRDLASKYYKARSSALSKRADRTIGKFKQEEQKSYGASTKMNPTGRRDDPKQLARIEKLAGKAESLIDRSEHMQSRASRAMRGK